jgi:hypothetical protein
MDTFITCHSCHDVVCLDTGPAAQLEMATFCAAHSRHPEPVGFELLLYPAPPGVTSSAGS